MGLKKSAAENRVEAVRTQRLASWFYMAAQEMRDQGKASQAIGAQLRADRHARMARRCMGMAV